MDTRTWVGATALAALALLGVLMAAAGPDSVPAAGLGGDPGWLRGAYGGGFGIGGGDFIHLERAALVAYAVVVACAAAIPRRLLWAGIVGLVVAFAIAPPLLSLDVFSYVSYARLDALHGLNPYDVPPEAFPSDPSLAFVLDNRDVVSVYGPLFTLLSLPLAHLGVAGAVYSLKALAALSVLGTALLCGRIAATRGLDPRPAAALVALNPLVLVHVVGGGHNDSLVALALTAGIAAVLAGRELAGGALIAAAPWVKATAAFAMPYALAEGLRRRRLLAGLLLGTALMLGIGLAVYGSAIDAAIDVARDNQARGSYSSLPDTIARELGISQDGVRLAATTALIAASLALLLRTLRGFDWIRAAGWVGLGLLLASSYITPWYVILPLPLAAVSRDRALVVATVLTSAFLLRYQVPGLGG